jgi:acetyltransferase-like isoleucine patch superfamily enzyme
MQIRGDLKMKFLWDKYQNNGFFLKTSSKVYNFINLNKRNISGYKNNILIKNSYLRKVKINIRGNNNTIEVNEKSKLSFINININGSNNKIIIGANCNLTNCRFVALGNNTIIEIGEKSISGNIKNGEVLFACVKDNNKISIGKSCLLAHDIEFRTGDGHNIFDENNQKINLEKNIAIGNHVWIAAYAKVLKGSVVSDDSVIALGSIITKKFEEKNCIIGGIPGKIIKKNINWEI